MASDTESVTVNLSEEQKSFLSLCEDKFKNRYTNDDPDYETICSVGIDTPPIIVPWFNKPRRNYDWTNRTRDQGSSDQRSRNYSSYNRNRYNNRNQGNSRKSYHQSRYNPY